MICESSPVLELKGSPAAATTKDRSIFQSWYANNLLDLSCSENARLIAFFGEKSAADMFGALKLKNMFPISHHFPSRFAKLKDCLPSPLANKHREADVSYHLGNLLFKQGDWAAAEQAQRRAIALDPTVAGFHRALSAALERREQPHEAASVRAPTAPSDIAA